MDERIPLIYTIYTSGYYGTEQMSLATAWGLRDRFAPTIISPPGPASAAAREMGFEVIESSSATATEGIRDVDHLGYSSILAKLLSRHRRLGFISTHPGHALCFLAVNAMYRRKAAQLHVQHGPPDITFAIRGVLNVRSITTVAISKYSKDRLVATGLRQARVKLIENFITEERVKNAPTRESFSASGIRHVAIVSRIVPVKRIDVLLEALEREPRLNEICFHVYGSGMDGDPYAQSLMRRATRNNLNVRFEGYRDDISARLAQADALVHLCPSEPFGLAILEAMIAGIPVIVPDTGGAGSVVENGVSGLHFSANDSQSLVKVVTQLRSAGVNELNRFVHAGRLAIETRFSARERLNDYRQLLMASLI